MHGPMKFEMSLDEAMLTQRAIRPAGGRSDRRRAGAAPDRAGAAGAHGVERAE